MQRNITVRNVTVLHDGHDHDYPVAGCDPCVANQATIGAVHGGNATVTDVLVEDVTAETSVWRPIWLGTPLIRHEAQVSHMVPGPCPEFCLRPTVSHRFGRCAAYPAGCDRS